MPNRVIIDGVDHLVNDEVLGLIQDLHADLEQDRVLMQEWMEALPPLHPVKVSIQYRLSAPRTKKA